MEDSQRWVKIEGEEFPKNLLDSNHMWKFREWIQVDKLDKKSLYGNPRAIHFLENHPEYIDWGSIQYCGQSYIQHLLAKNPEKIKWLQASTKPHSRYWIMKNIDKINIEYLNMNPSAIWFFKENPEKIDWKHLSMNQNAIELFFGNEDKLNMTYLSMNQNPEVIPFLERNIDKVVWQYIFTKNVEDKRWLEFIIRNLDKIKNERDWRFISEIRNKDFLHILEENKEKIDWINISSNPHAYRFLKENLDKISWYQFSINSSDEAVEYLIQNPEKIKWDFFSSNRSLKAMEYMSKNIDKIRWLAITNNPNIFMMDKEFLRKRMDIVREELMMRTWHPDRFQDWCLEEEFACKM